jgi:hypothetical protein
MGKHTDGSLLSNNSGGYTDRQQGDLISLLTKIKGGGDIQRDGEKRTDIQADGQTRTDMDGYEIERQQGNLISLFYFFKIRKID